MIYCSIIPVSHVNHGHLYFIPAEIWVTIKNVLPNGLLKISTYDDFVPNTIRCIKKTEFFGYFLWLRKQW